MNRYVRILAAVILLALTGFCASGWLATFKPQFRGNWGMRLICLFTGSACLYGSVLLLLPRKPEL
jgi:hypothetical protein